MFSTNTQTVTSQAEKVTFTCDTCGFTANSERGVVLHFGEKHAVKATKHCGEFTFYRLEDEASFDAWHLASSSRDRRRASSYSKFKGPGWYRIDTWESPCPRGCCTDSWLGIEFAPEVLKTMREELIERARSVAELRTLLREAP
jgi:hypothetical protein